MLKKIFSYILLLALLSNNLVVFSLESSLDIKLIFQNPSYLLEKDTNTSKFTCDSLESECKVNYNLEINEGSGYKSVGTKYTCEWDFGLGQTTGEENKCNPNTIIYPVGEYKTTYKITLKTDENIFYYNEIIIKNGEIVSETPPETTPENTNTGEIINEEPPENTSSGSTISEENTNSGTIIIEEIDEGIHTSSGNIVDENTSSGENINGEIPEIVEEVSNTGSILEEENTNSGIIIDENQTNTGIISNTGSINTFQIKYLLQSPSYLFESGSENYNCDTVKTDCKVNFNLNVDEGTGGYKSIDTKYICEWDFGFAEITGEETKCNPNTITYPVGNFKTTYKVLEKSNSLNFIEKSFFVKNEGFKEESIPTKIVYVGGGSSSSSSSTKLNIEIPKIIIQSGLDESGNCKKEDCSINLNYNQNNSNELCLWDFPGGVFEEGTKEKCNPGYVKYPVGDFKVTLKVYEDGNLSNFKESYLYFTNKKISVPVKQEIKESKKIEENIKEEDKEENNILTLEQENEVKQNYFLKISKVSPNPVGVDNLEFIEIQNVGNKEIDLSSCSLDDEVGAGSKPYFFKEPIILKPQESKKFYKYDTKININNSAKEEINLFCEDILIDNLKWNFSVSQGFILSPDLDLEEISGVKKQKSKNIYEINYNSGETKTVSFDESFDILDEVMKEDLSREEKKEKLFLLVEKSFYQKISKQRSGVKVYGTTLPNTKVIIKLEKLEDEFSFLNLFYSNTFASNNTYETKSDKNGSYELYIKEPNIGEFEVKTLLSFSEDNNFEIPKKTSLEIDEDYLNYINSSKELSKNQEKEYIKPKAIITLQGKITQNKTFSNNKLVCFDTLECSVNLDGTHSEGKKLKYLWDFGNGKIFDKKNPASYKFPVGKHIISLIVSDEKSSDTSFFMVEVQGKIQKQPLKSEKVENKTTKNNKIDIIPPVYADDSKKDDIQIHIVLSLIVLFVFIIGGLILFKRQKML